MRNEAQAFKAKCTQLAKEAPAEFWKAKETLGRMLPLLESDGIISRNRGRIFVLAKEAEEGIHEGSGEAMEMLTSRKGRWASGVAFFGGASAIAWGIAFGEIGGWCENILKAGGALSILSGIGIQAKGMYRLGQSIEFPVDATLFLERLERHLGILGNKD